MQNGCWQTTGVVVMFLWLLVVPVTGWTKLDHSGSGWELAWPPQRSTSIGLQADWNTGTFNRVSADRKDNAGVLGIGYLNSTLAGQSNDRGMNNASLHGYWRMDASSDPLPGSFDVKDYSGHDVNGTSNGFDGDERGSQGVFSTNGFMLDGTDDYVTVPDQSSISSLDPGTFSFWFNPATDLSGGTENNWGFISKQDEFEIGNCDCHSDGSSIAMGIWGDRMATSKNAWSAGEWYHVVFVVDSANDVFEVYVNGTLDNSKTPGDSITDSASDLAIGYSLDHSNPFNGAMDEVRIYNRTLSAEEIKQLYLAGADGAFEGNYTRETINTDAVQTWNNVQVDATMPAETEAWITFEALDGDESVVDSELFSLSAGTVNYSLSSVSDSEDARWTINGTSTNISNTWETADVTTFHRQSGGGWTKWP